MEGCGLKEIRLVNPVSESEKLLSLDYKSASQLFQSYSIEQQLAIIEATREPKKREELYYRHLTAQNWFRKAEQKMSFKLFIPC